MFEPHLSPCFEEVVVRGPYVRILNLKGYRTPAWVISLASLTWDALSRVQHSILRPTLTVRIKNLQVHREGHHQILWR